MLSEERLSVIYCSAEMQKEHTAASSSENCQRDRCKCINSFNINSQVNAVLPEDAPKTTSIPVLIFSLVLCTQTLPLIV